MPFKHPDAHRHHISKAPFRVRNWPVYNAGLCQRGSITLWLSPTVVESWQAPKQTGRGGNPIERLGYEAARRLAQSRRKTPRKTMGKGW